MNLHSDIRIWLWVIIYCWYISNFTKLFTFNKNQNFVLLLQVPCSILAPLFSLNTLVTRSGDPTPPLKSQGQDSCIYILLYNNDKEKVIRYRYRSDTATRFSILARQQNWKRFPALISRLLIFRDWSMLPYFGHFLQNLQQSSKFGVLFSTSSIKFINLIGSHFFDFAPEDFLVPTPHILWSPFGCLNARKILFVPNCQITPPQESQERERGNYIDHEKQELIKS